MKKLSCFACAALLSLTSCAGFFDNSRQDIKVTSSGSKKASCRVLNNFGSWNLTTPATVKVKKSKSDLKIYCANKSAGTKGSALVKAVPEKTGLFSESWSYPSQIHIKMVGKKTPLSNYEDPTSNDEEWVDDPDSRPLNKLPEAPE